MPLPYFGGKGGPKLGRWLFENFDLSGINNYVEPFAGMFGIYLGKFSDFSRVENIIYNDIDKQNCNIINCCQVPLFFLDEITTAFRKGGVFFNKRGTSYEEKYENYRSIYLDYRKGVKQLPAINLTIRHYQAAVIYSFLRLTSIKQFHFLKVDFKKFIIEESWFKRYKFIQPLINKLNDIDFQKKIARIKSITADDFGLVMNRYNTPESFIYLDPPYFTHEDDYDHYDTDVFSVADHQRLADMVKNSKARIAVSYYYFPGLYKLYPKKIFRYEKLPVFSNAAGKTKTEYLIMNY